MRTQEKQERIFAMLQRILQQIERLLPVPFSLALLGLNYQQEVGTLLTSVLSLAVVAYVAVTDKTLRSRLQHVFRSFRLARRRCSSRIRKWIIQLITRKKVITSYRSIRRCAQN